MQPAPNPTPLDDTLNSVRRVIQHRKLNCPTYARCLDTSISKGWESFSCLQCPLASKVDSFKPDVSRYAQQHRGDKFGP